MKSIRFRLMAAALAVLMGSAIAKSQTEDNTPPPPPIHGHHFRMDTDSPTAMFLLHKLNLTDEQKAQMHAIMKKEHPAMQPLFQQQHDLDVQLRQYVEGPYDEAKVQALAQQKAQVEAQLTVAQTRVHNQLYALLTPEQQSQLKELEAQHDARMQERITNHGPAAPPSE